MKGSRTIFRTLTVVAVALVVVFTGQAHASEKEDLFPSTATDSSNWHRYRFYVSFFGDDVAVNEIFTLLWDTPGTGVLLAIFDTTDPADPELKAVSAGNDRMARLDIGLLEGTY